MRMETSRSASSPNRLRIRRAARQARSAWSSTAMGAPKRAMMPSPWMRLTIPPLRGPQRSSARSPAEAWPWRPRDRKLDHSRRVADVGEQDREEFPSADPGRRVRPPRAARRPRTQRRTFARKARIRPTGQAADDSRGNGKIGHRTILGGRIRWHPHAGAAWSDHSRSGNDVGLPNRGHAHWIAVTLRPLACVVPPGHPVWMHIGCATLPPTQPTPDFQCSRWHRPSGSFPLRRPAGSRTVGDHGFVLRPEPWEGRAHPRRA